MPSAFLGREDRPGRSGLVSGPRADTLDDRDELRVREKAATRELDAITAQRRRLPMVQLPEYTLVGRAVAAPAPPRTTPGWVSWSLTTHGS